MVALLLIHICLACWWSVGLALALSSNAAVVRGSSSDHAVESTAVWRTSGNRESVAAIPSWKLEARADSGQMAREHDHERAQFGPLPLLDSSLGSNPVGYPGQFLPAAYKNSDGFVAPSGYKIPAKVTHAITSTAAQDLQHCPLLQLPPVVLAERKEEGLVSLTLANIRGQKGIWMTQSGVALATWEENFMSHLWQTVQVNSVDGGLAIKIVPRTEAELFQMYGWKASKAAHADSTSFLIADCEDEIMFVVRLHVGLPDTIEIYDRLGGLAANSLTDATVARHQFIDAAGSLLATAESPGLSMDLARRPSPEPGETGTIQPYAIRFEAGGYANASRLLDQEYRWVILAAVQARAVFDARTGWTPIMPHIATVISWSGVFFLSLLLLLICFCLFRLVYPTKAKDETSLLGIVDPKRGLVPQLQLAYT